MYNMSEKIFLFPFILCVILCQGIVGDSSEDVGESNSLFRRKRVINEEPGGDIPLKSGEASYVVNIRELPRNASICTGTILTKRTVITSALCIGERPAARLTVRCGSIYKFRGETHDVTEIKIRFGNHPQRDNDGIALLIVEPSFIFNANTRSIRLHQGPLLPGTPANIIGWGCNPTAPMGTAHPNRLRSIRMLIMPHQDCVNSYRGHFIITEKDICTFHEMRRCGQSDGGAPLVVNNTLAGVYLFTGVFPGRLSPDIFVDIQNLEYGSWIQNNMVVRG